MLQDGGRRHIYLYRGTDLYAGGGLSLGGRGTGVGVVGKGELVPLRELLGDAVELFVAVIRPQEAPMNG